MVVRLGIFATMALMAGQVWAQDMTEIQPGERVKIDRQGTCRIIENGGGTEIMVPHSKAVEWVSGGGAFLNNIPSMSSVRVFGCDWPSYSHPLEIWTAIEGQDRFRIWADGSSSAVMFSTWDNPGITLPPATFYNELTGQCAPAKSLIKKGAQIEYMADSIYKERFYVQICETDRIATAPTPDPAPSLGSYPGP